MKLKTSYDSFDEVPEALRELYVQDGDRFVLDLDDVDAHPGVRNLKSAFEREKEDRRKAREQIRALEAKLGEVGDLDPDEARKALQKIRELEDKQLLDKGELDKLVERRTERMKLDYENQIKALSGNLDARTGERDAFQKQLHEHVIESGLRDAAIRKGVRPEAVSDVLHRLRPTWHLRDGRPVPMDGEDIIFGRDGKGPLTMEESVEGLLPVAPHLFADSAGGKISGARPGGGGSKPVIAFGDSAALSANLEEVAANKFNFTDS